MVDYKNFPNLIVEDNIFKTSLARQNWESKYQYAGEEPLETFKRVASSLASVEDDKDYWYGRFLDVLLKTEKVDGGFRANGLKNTFGGRITANAGTEYGGATMINCFSGNEKLLTKEHGSVSFSEVLGKKVTVLSQDGWEPAEVQEFGTQQLNLITFRPANRQDISHLKEQDGFGYRTFRGTYGISVEATHNHRWVLADGTETTDLRVGDVVPSVVSAVDRTSDEFIDGFRHGFVFGDGHLKYTYKDGLYNFELRLFGEKDLSHAHMFEEVRSVNWKGVENVLNIKTHKNLKALPEKNSSTEYIAGFIDGWLAADGSVRGKASVELSSTNLEGLTWIREHAPLAGYVATGYRVDYHSEETNLGKRNSLLKRLILSKADDLFFKVTSIVSTMKEEPVFCAVVPGSGTFTLSSGIFTGNCYINGPIESAKITYERTAKNGTKIPVEINTQATGDSLSNIMLALLEQAETLKSEGGYGINFGFIRPRGSVIKGVGIKHPGVIHYMDVWDKLAGVIVMGDNDGYKDEIENHLIDDLDSDVEIKLKKQARKGAQMAVLPIWHPDIEEFVRAKQEPGRLTKFNISVLVDNTFMNAVENDDFYDLMFDGVVYKRVKARELYDLIMASTYNRAEPGVLFYDNMQANNPLDYLGSVEATNPCGEVPGNPLTTTVCLLGSINLTQYVNEDRTFDWDGLREDIPVFLRALDNVNDLSYNPLPHYNWATENVRQVGMGINGLGSALYMMGIKFNSEEGFEFTRQLSEMKEDLLWRTSAELAEEKGPFPAYTEDFLETPWFKDFTLISEETKNLIRQHGVRNGKVSMNAPNGNTSIICDITSNGIEPIFMHEYQRTRIVDSWPDGLTKGNVKELLKESKAGDAVVWQGEYAGETYYYEPHNRGLCIIEPVRDYGYQWVMDHYPEDIENNADYLVTTEQLSVNDHVDSQAIIQRNLSQSVSKTINLPAGYSFDKFKDLYTYAWREGLIGCTTYVAGSMEAVISEKNTSNDDEEEVDQVLDDVVMPAEFYNGETSVIKREGAKFYIHFSYSTPSRRRPIAIWITTNTQAPIRHTNQAVNLLLDLAKEKGIKQSHIDDVKEKIKENTANNRLARAVSFCLRHRIPILDIVLKLEKLEEVYVTDLVFAIRKFLSSYIEEGTTISGKTCDNCGSSNIEFSGGCSTCLDCGSSGCS